MSKLTTQPRRSIQRWRHTCGIRYRQPNLPLAATSRPTMPLAAWPTPENPLCQWCMAPVMEKWGPSVRYVKTSPEPPRARPGRRHRQPHSVG